MLLRRYHKKPKEVKAKETELSKESESKEAYPKHTGGGWYELSSGEKVQGKKEAQKLEVGG